MPVSAAKKCLYGRNPYVGFAGHIDPGRVGIFGHSFGGNSVARVMKLNPRMSRAVILDGTGINLLPPATTIRRTLLVLEGNVPMTPEWKARCDAGPAGATIEQMFGAMHINFSDAGVLPSRFPLPKSWLMLGNSGVQLSKGVQ